MLILWAAEYEFLPEGYFERDWCKVVLAPVAKGYNFEALVPHPNKNYSPIHLMRFPKLEVVATPSTGTNHLPVDWMKEHDIKLLSLLDDRGKLQDIRASSEFAWLLILACLRHLPEGYLQLKAKRPRDERLFRGNELFGKTVGIVGMGRIGRNIYRWCKAFGAHPDFLYDPPAGNSAFSLEEVFACSDIVVVSCTLNEETEGMINENVLDAMKEHAILVNISRGEVIDEKALVRVLTRRPDLRVGIDVMQWELTGGNLNSPLLNYNNVIATPHMAGITFESQQKAADITMGLLKEWHERSA